MTNKVYNQIVKDIKRVIFTAAGKNDWLWFYDMHQKEVLNCAEKLLKLYKADDKTVLLACWLHDISKYQIKSKRQTYKYHKTHHIDCYKFSLEFLKDYDISQKEIDKICNCIIRHRNTKPYLAENIEEKIVTVADTLSHFTSIFYFTHFLFHPDDSIDDMVDIHIKKIKKDWADLWLLPKAQSLVKNEFETLLKLHKNYRK